MRWETVWICAVSVVVLMGCPHSFGRGGTIDRAAHKDAQDMNRQDECTEDFQQTFCSEDPESEECRRVCGG